MPARFGLRLLAQSQTDGWLRGFGTILLAGKTVPQPCHRLPAHHYTVRGAIQGSKPSAEGQTRVVSQPAPRTGPSPRIERHERPGNSPIDRTPAGRRGSFFVRPL